MEYIFIKPEDEYYASEEKFRNFLCTNKRITFDTTDKSNKSTLSFDNYELDYALECTKVEKSKEIIFRLIVEVSGTDDEQTQKLEVFDSLIKEINEKCGRPFSINTIWNDVSSYYGKKLYPDIVNLENTLRKIIYLFMLKTIGSGWLDTNTPEKFQTSIESIIEKNNKKRSDIDAEWLIYADFIDLGKFFTAPYPLKSDLTSLFKILEQYGDMDITDDEKDNSKTTPKAKKHKKAKTLTKELIQKLSDEYEPKNNWDRYFSDKLSVNSPNKFSNDWSSLYDIRNKVAHGKPIGKAIFDKATNLINTYTKYLMNALA